MEDKRKRFNVAEFISNEETPVETRDGRNVEIYNAHRENTDYPVVGDIHDDEIEKKVYVETWTSDGRSVQGIVDAGDDLFFSPKKTVRRMTNQELSWWLRDHPEEHREWKWNADGASIDSVYTYNDNKAVAECGRNILIRSNGGEWREPVVEIEI
jgi:hypothetical protein